MFAILAGILFLIGAILQAVNGPDLDVNWMFWLLAGFSALAFHYAWSVAPRSLLDRQR